MQKEFNAVTLIEVLIIIIVIGVLIALSLPQFGKTKEHAIVKEAIANLKLIAAAERIYRMEAGAYYPISADTEDSIAEINNNLRLSLAERNWDYAVVTATDPAVDFTSTAKRQSGPYSSCEYTLAYNDADGEPNPNASCP